MKYLGDYAEDYATLNFKFSTHKADGTPITLAGTPVVKVYKGSATTTETATGVTLAVDFDSVTGLHNVLIDLSADAFYATANDYSVVITTGTVDSVSVVGTVLATFSIQNRVVSAVTGAVGSVTGAVTIAASQLVFKKNVARANFAFPMFDSAGALKTGLTVTAVIRKDAGASFSALAGSVTEIGTTGWYTVDFAQAETNADTIAFSTTATGALPTTFTILTQA